VGRGDPISEGLIREIHKRLVRGGSGNSAAPGEYRRIQSYVANSITREIIYGLFEVVNLHYAKVIGFDAAACRQPQLRSRVVSRQCDLHRCPRVLNRSL
jgi:hypothetical protein